MTIDETDEDLELIRLEDEFEDMCDEYDVVRRGGDFNAARQLGKEIRAFARLHQQTLDIADEQIDKLAAIFRHHELRWQRQEICEADVKKAERRIEELTEEYHQLLLEQPPQGRRRTAH